MSTHRTVLVIADSDQRDNDYGYQLQQDGSFSYQILTGQYGAPLVELSRSQQIDGILIDFHTPHSGSFDMLRQLKHQVGEHCPLVVVMDNSDADMAVQAFKHGAADYLVKTRMTPDDLRLAMRSAIANADLQRELQRSQEQFQTSVENMDRKQLALALSQTVAALEASQTSDRNLAEAMPLMVWQKQLEARLLDEIANHKHTEQELRATNQKVTRILESMTDAYVALDQDWRITYVNQVAADINHVSMEELIGRSHWEVWADTKGTSCEEYYNWAIAHQTPVHFDYFYETRQRWYEVHAYPSPDGLGIYYRDVHDRKQIETLLRESQAQLQRQLVEIEAIYQSAPIGLNVLDPDLRFVRVNQQLADINGFPVEAHIGHTVRELFPDLADTVEPLLRPILETGEPLLNVEICGETPAQPGVKRTWREHFLPLKQGDQVIGISTVCEEITDRIRVEKALRQSEERFRNMADHAPVMIWVTDITGYCTYLSNRWYTFTGQTEATGLGFGWLEAVHPDDRDFSRDIFLRASEHHEAFQLEYRLRRHDGEYQWAIDAARPWLGEDGEFKGYIGSVIDISDRKQAEEALRRSEERYRTLFESMEDGFCVIELLFDETNTPIDYRFLEINPSFAQQTGLHQAVGKTARQLVPNLENHWFEIYGQVALTREPIRFENGSDEMNRWFEVYAFPVEAPEKRKVAILFKDISDRKAIEIQREQLLQQEQVAREAAERANRIKDEFLAVLSHELRSPLNPILGWTKLLQTRQLDAARTTEALNTIERNAKLQTQLIDDLLDVAKILRGKLSLSMSPVNLTTVIEAAIDTVKIAAEAKSISLQATLPTIGQVSGDATRLQQVVWNLLSNAIKFTREGGHVEISLSLVTHQSVWGALQQHQTRNQEPRISYAQLQVKDSGKGINSDFLPYIFESFRQEDASITRKYGGLGLGLAIVRQLVEAHGGTIAASSPGEGLGATFTVRLPLLEQGRIGELERTRTIEYPLSATSPLPSRTVDSPLAGVRVLTVDDDPDTRELLTALLAQYGADVLTVASAAEALANLGSFQPDVLVSDLGMPEVDGYTLLQQVRSLPPDQGGQIPAIALTAYARDDDRQRVLTSGYQRHVTKPLEPDQLVRAVAALTHSK
jgi:PAS domain S-box-containing protein